MSKIITGYQIVGSDSLSDLEYLIQIELIKGYQPLGGVIVNDTSHSAENLFDVTSSNLANGKKYLQTMVQYETDEEELERKQERKELEEERKEAERNKKRFYNEKV